MLKKMNEFVKEYWPLLSLSILVIVIIFGVISVIDVNMKAETEAKFEAIKLLFKAKEHAYMEGQKDALEGDVRIIKTQDGDWEWVTSPWDSTFSPMFKRLSDYKVAK